MYNTLRTLAGQLLAVPGAPDKLLADYFSKVVINRLADDRTEHATETWQLADGSMLFLIERPENVILEYCRPGTSADAVALPLPAELLQAASQSGDHKAGPYCVSPLLLALVAVAAGYVDGDRALRKSAPDLLRCAQELLLIAACRLCG